MRNKICTIHNLNSKTWEEGTQIGVDSKQFYNWSGGWLDWAFPVGLDVTIRGFVEKANRSNPNSPRFQVRIVNTGDGVVYNGIRLVRDGIIWIKPQDAPWYVCE